MNDFIKKQQELARTTVLDLWPNDDEITQTVMREVDTLITQIITNAGEELLRRAEGERYVTSAEEHEKRRDYATKGGYEKAIDTLKKHIASLTGAK